MSNVITIDGISYTRSKAILDEMRKIHKTAGDDYMKKVSKEVFTDGRVSIFARPFSVDAYISIFARPFSVDAYISLYGGENTFFLSFAGGHGVSAFLAESPVDGRHEILYNKWSFDLQPQVKPKDGVVALRLEIIEICELHLPKEIVQILRQNNVLSD